MSSGPHAIGIDIGGTKIAIAAVDTAGRVRAQVHFPTESRQGAANGLGRIVTGVRQVWREAAWSERDVGGIGIGCAGPVSPARGTVHNPFTLPGWDGADVVTPLREAFGVPVRLENDADAAALGEYHFGAGRGADPLVMVTLGTGVGGAVVVGGKIYRGAAGEHPEIGHLIVASDGPDCYCGARGCWESLASGSALASAGRAFGWADGRVVFAASTHASDAAAIVERAVAATAMAAWSLAHTFLPQRLVLGGSIGVEHFERFARAIRHKLDAGTQVPKGSVGVVRAELGTDAGVIGAAALCFSSPHPKLP